MCVYIYVNKVLVLLLKTIMIQIQASQRQAKADRIKMRITDVKINKFILRINY